MVIIFCNLAALRSIRKISPLVSAMLAVLLFAGNSGYTFIFHNCNECMVQEARHSIASVANGACCFCYELPADNTAGKNQAPVMRHHCHHEIDRLETSELVKTDLQNDFTPFLTSARVVFLPPLAMEIKSIRPDLLNKNFAGRDITTLHCQILS